MVRRSPCRPLRAGPRRRHRAATCARPATPMTMSTGCSLRAWQGYGRVRGTARPSSPPPHRSPRASSMTWSETSCGRPTAMAPAPIPIMTSVAARSPRSTRKAMSPAGRSTAKATSPASAAMRRRRAERPSRASPACPMPARIASPTSPMTATAAGSPSSG